MKTRRIVWFVLGSLAGLAMACTEDARIPPPMDLEGGAPSSPGQPGDGPSAEQDDSVPCGPITAQPGPARERILGDVLVASDDPPEGETSLEYTLQELFDSFQSQCAACHAVAGFTPLDVASLSDFVDRVDEKSIERMTSTDPKLVMPMGNKFLQDRMPTDPVVQLEARLAAWLEQGKPESFADPLASSDGAEPRTGAYVLSRTLGQALTNMGSCKPAARIVSFDEAAMDEHDALFAGLTDVTELPKLLSETDLDTLDSEALAKRGVLSYAPGYTLWADDSHKMRYIRVPRGQTIAFDEATQSFDIPDDTRFYKTFLKEVKDLDGNVGYRKIETRLIVVRRAVDSGAGLPEIKALYGTYRWNDDETEANLVDEPLNNGRPFPDTRIDYVVDEALEQEVRSDPDFEKLSENGQKNRLFDQGAYRHYFIPGSKRCTDCHMGGEGGTFVLGFTPLQIRRREMGEGGVIEPAMADEVNQLERFIDYGLISGLTKAEIAKKVLPLESSQGDRLPRNDYELAAQGYMLGNCAHCHNPNGFPTRTAPVLRDVLNFLPSADGGGIFQFPLDRFSPRIRRGLIPAPYITPSIHEQILVFGDTNNAPGDLAAQVDIAPAPAPWRSLIYRNVDTTFTYSDGKTIFPHMPMHTAGFDCRAPRVMAEWMISIPSKLRSCAPGTGGARDKTSVDFCTDFQSLEAPDGDAPQPYEEVRPGDSHYPAAMLDVADRLREYHAGERYNSCQVCPDTYDRNADSTAESSWDQSVLSTRYFSPVQVPTNRCHYVVTDLTVQPGPWSPRNGKWEDVLVNKDVTSFNGDKDNNVSKEQQQATQKSLATVLQGMKLDDELKTLATTEVPLGLWQERPGCSFPGVKTVGDLGSQPGWGWLDDVKDAQAHVYMASPGGALFNQTCINCHGPNLDAGGRQADTVAQLSGGRTTVANWREGMFGPVGMTRQAREDEFGAAPSSKGTVDDWAARYLAWMALGGTQKFIPPPVLAVVGSEPIVGLPVRRNVRGSANMLSIALNVCRTLLSNRPGEPELYTALATVVGDDAETIADNGDREVWRRVCGYKNPRPIVAVTLDLNADLMAPTATAQIDRLYLRKDRSTGLSTYPAGAPIKSSHLSTKTGAQGVEIDVDKGTVVQGLTDDVEMPVCYLRPVGKDALIDAYLQAGALPKDVPWCPDALLSNPSALMTIEEKAAWVQRGAANAGFMVYAYVDAVTAGTLPPLLGYDQCEVLESRNQSMP